MNMVRAVLLEKEVPKIFWPDVVQWVNHVLNRSPTHIVKDMTSEEAWSGRSLLSNTLRFSDVSDMFIFQILKEASLMIKV